MMAQFEVWVIGGKRMLMQVDTSRYDFWWGFHRPVKDLDGRPDPTY